MRVIVVMAIMMLSAIALAQTWHTANQITFAWDPVEKIVATDTIKYQVYIQPAGTSQRVSSGPEITATQATVSFSEEGRYFLCVQALRYPQGEAQPIKSEISCSDMPGAVQGGKIFGAAYFRAPEPPHGLRMATP